MRSRSLDYSLFSDDGSWRNCLKLFETLFVWVSGGNVDRPIEKRRNREDKNKRYHDESDASGFPIGFVRCQVAHQWM